MPKIERVAATAMIVAALWPALAWGQVTKAGIVTNLGGTVSARRVANPQGVPLKFKDDVFLRDTIATAENSYARMLLGGKAVVSVREKSEVTITEMPGHSRVDIGSGKVGFAVARERMKPGEILEIQTPTAMLAVRGTSLYVEVIAALGARPSRTTVTVTSGTVEMTSKLPTGRMGSPANVTAGKTATTTGTGGTPTVTDASVEKLNEAKGDTPLAKSGTGSAEAVSVAASTAQGLITALTDPTVAQSVFGTTTVQSPTTQTQTSALSTPLYTAFQTSGTSTLQTWSDLGPLFDPSHVVNESLELPAGQPGGVFATNLTRTDTSSLGVVSGSTVYALGQDDMIAVNPGVTATLSSPLLQVSDSAILAGRYFLDVAGTLTGLNGSPFVDIDPSVIYSASDLIHVAPGGTLSSTGTLVRAVDSVIVGGAQGLHVVGTSAPGPTTVSLSGRLFDFTDTTVIVGNNLVRLIDGGSLVGSGVDVPLVSFAGGGYAGGGAYGTSSGGSLLRMFSQVGQPGSALMINGPYFSATNATIVSTDSPLFNITDGSTIRSSSSLPFASFSGGTVDSASSFFVFDTNTSFTPQGSTTQLVGSGAQVTVNLNGTLIASNGTDFVIINNNGFLRILDNTHLTLTGGAALIDLTGGSVTSEATLLGITATNSAAAPPVVSLSGPAINVNGTTLCIGATFSAANCAGSTPMLGALSFIGDGASVKSTSTSPFITINGSTDAEFTDIISIRRSRYTGSPTAPTSITPTTLTLSGPLAKIVNSTVYNMSPGFQATYGTAESCCSAVSVGQGASLVSNTSESLIQIIGSRFNAGPDPTSGGGALFAIYDTFTGAPSTDVVAPASVSLNGGVLSIQDSNVTALQSAISVTRSSLSANTTAPLVTVQGTSPNGAALSLGGIDPFTNSKTFSSVLAIFGSSSSGAAGATTSVTTGGGVLSATNASVTTNFNIVKVQNGASLTTGASPAVQLQNSSVTIDEGSDTSRWNTLAYVAGFGGPSGTASATWTLNGPLLTSDSGSTLDLRDGLLAMAGGGLVDGHTVTSPLASINGGTHTLATRAFNGLIQIYGASSPASLFQSQTVDTGYNLSLATTEHLKYGGTLVQMTGATIGSPANPAYSGMIFDRTLYNASAPLLDARASSAFNLANSVLTLQNQANVNAIGPVIRLDASTVTVTNQGILVQAGGSGVGSYLNITSGDLFQLLNGSHFSVTNGPLIAVRGGSVVNVYGSLVNFGGSGGNVLQYNNSLCTGCATAGGITYVLQNSASPSNISITNPIKNGALGSLTGSGAAIVLDGANSRIRINGN